MTDKVFWYSLDLEIRASVAEDFVDMPLSALGLSTQSRRALLRSDRSMDVAKLLLSDSSIRDISGLGLMRIDEMNEILLSLIGQQYDIETIPMLGASHVPDASADGWVEPDPSLLASIFEGRHWYQLNRAARARVAKDYVDVPLHRINLPTKIRNALLRYRGDMDVAMLLLADESIIDVGLLGPASIDEIDRAMQALIKQDIERKVALSKDIGDFACDWLIAPLPVILKSQPIHVLGLPRATRLFIEDCGIDTVGLLHSLIERRKLASYGLSPGMIRNIRVSFDSLSKTHPSDYEGVDAAFESAHRSGPQLGYANEPKSYQEIMDSMPRIVEAVLEEKRDRRAWMVVQLRFGLDGARQHTLAEVGDAVFLTRERVRQVQCRSVEVLRATLVEYASFSDTGPIERSTVAAVRTIILDIVRRAHQPILVQVLLDEFASENNVEIETMRALGSLLFSVAGIEQIKFRSQRQAPVCVSNPSAWPATGETILAAIDHFLTSAQPTEANVLDIQREVNLSLPDSEQISLLESLRFARLCSTIEELPVQRFRGRFEFLRSGVDQAYRIFSESDEPLHISDIHDNLTTRMMASGFLSESQRRLAKQMSLDPRFQALSTTGLWRLVG